MLNVLAILRCNKQPSHSRRGAPKKRKQKPIADRLSKPNVRPLAETNAETPRARTLTENLAHGPSLTRRPADWPEGRFPAAAPAAACNRGPCVSCRSVSTRACKRNCNGTRCTQNCKDDTPSPFRCLARSHRPSSVAVGVGPILRARRIEP